MLTRNQVENKIYALQNRRCVILDSNPQAKVGMFTNMKKLSADTVKELDSLEVLETRLLNVYNNRW